MPANVGLAFRIQTASTTPVNPYEVFLHLHGISMPDGSLQPIAGAEV
jgi:hypothetical protein